jgi:2-C-methyl-D-erythritol 4-phosphate cytidylyltransferase
MVEWSLEALRAAPSVLSIVVACPPGHLGELAGRDLDLVEGGATRAQSVANALAGVDTELVAIHDAARPLVTPELIEGVVATLVADPRADGAIAAAPIADTLKRAVPAASMKDSAPPGGTNPSLSVEATLDRARLWAAQTPQVFRVEALRRALEVDPDAIAAATDEATLVERAGGRVLIHPHSAPNLKVTTPLDLRLAESLLGERGIA